MKKIGILLLILIAATGIVGCSNKTYVYEHKGKEYTVDVSSNTISDAKNTYSYSYSGYGDSKTIEIVYPNNRIWSMTISEGVGTFYETNSDVISAYPSGNTLYSVISQAEDEHGGVSPMKVIMGIIGVGLCMVPVIAPYQCWQLAHGWKFRDAEPSDAYIVLARVFGILLAIAWVVIVILIKE